MKFKLSSIFAIVVFILMLGGCVSARNKKCPDFGGGSWNIEQKVSPNSHKAVLLVDQNEISNGFNLDQFQDESVEILNQTSHKVKLKKNFKNPEQKEVLNRVQFEQIKNETKAKTSIKRKIGRSIGWLSVLSGLVGMLNIAFIAFSVLAILIGLLGIKLKISNWGTILSYIGIGFGVLGILSPILNTIVGVLILVVLILVLLKLYHYI
jgi:hypothetical protein